MYVREKEGVPRFRRDTPLGIRWGRVVAKKGPAPYKSQGRRSLMQAHVGQIDDTDNISHVARRRKILPGTLNSGGLSHEATCWLSALLD